MKKPKQRIKIEYSPIAGNWAASLEEKKFIFGWEYAYITAIGNTPEEAEAHLRAKLALSKNEVYIKEL